MKTPNDFAVFILSHGRPDNIRTLKCLQKQNYTGRVYIVIDDEDTTGDRYRELYGDMVITFNKADIASRIDECDNFDIPRKAVLYARNACFEIAPTLGVRWFLQLDDDYQHFEYRFSADLRPAYYSAQNLDRLFSLVLAFYQSIPALTIALAQGGDLIGGAQNQGTKTLNLKRKAMNSFFCCVDRPFKFIGRINEDVNTYTTLGARGHLIFTIFNASLVQTPTQSQSGGMTDSYLAQGTYVKSMYTVINAPSFVTIKGMGETARRLHHSIKWDHAVPVIISENYRKL